MSPNAGQGPAYTNTYTGQSQQAMRNANTLNQIATQSPYQADIQGQKLPSRAPLYPRPPYESIGSSTSNASGRSTAPSAATSNIRASSASLSNDIGRLNSSSKHRETKKLEPSAAAPSVTSRAKGWFDRSGFTKNNRDDDKLRSTTALRTTAASRTTSARQTTAAPPNNAPPPACTPSSPPKVLTMIVIEQIPSVISSGDIRAEMQRFGLNRVTTHSREFKHSTAIFPALHEIVQYAKVILTSWENAEKAVAHLYHEGIKCRDDGQRYAVSARILDEIDWSL